MVYRETPRCSYCGKPVAKAIYNPPSSPTFIGDTFSHWKHWLCECEEAVAERERLQKEMKPHVEKLNKALKKSKKEEKEKKERIAKKLKEKAEYRRKMWKSIKSKLNEEELKFLKLNETSK